MGNNEVYNVTQLVSTNTSLGKQKTAVLFLFPDVQWNGIIVCNGSVKPYQIETSARGEY